MQHSQSAPATTEVLEPPAYDWEDAETFASGLLTPTTTWSERTRFDGVGRDAARSLGETGGPTSTGYASSAPSRRSSRSSRSSRTGRGRRPRPESPGRLALEYKRRLLFVSLVPVAVFVVIALIGWWMQSSGPTGGHMGLKADPIDEFIASQNDWVAVADLVTEYDYLPFQIKGGETEMIDLMIAVKYSDLRGREHLVKEMQEFATVADRVVDGLIDWNSLAGATVDKIQNMNYHALSAYRNLQAMASWAVIPAPAGGELGLIPSLQHLAHIFSVSVVGNKEAETKELQRLLVHEADRAGGQLRELKVTGTVLVADFKKLANHLQNIADIARSEDAQARAEVKELLSGLWGYLGFNDYAAADLSAQAQMLAAMADAMMQGHGYINKAMVTIRTLDKNFNKVKKALSESKWEHAGAMPLRLDNIQAAIDKLDAVTKSSRAKIQSQQYMAARHQMAINA